MAGMDIDDTIVAIASAPGPAVRGIVRVSGPNTADVITKIFRSDSNNPISDCRATSAISGRLFLEPADAERPRVQLPVQLLYWPTQKSYTRQPTAEFHLLGSPPVLQMVVAEICRAGARLANPGEFTLRAFLSGRIDLTQAEAVLAVIDSDGEQQLATALGQLAGGLAGPLGEIRGELMSVLAELEAGLDFVEEDIEFISEAELSRQLTEIRNQLGVIESQIKQRDLIDGLVKVVLLGMPNSGKSSLFNALTETEQAIVTNVEGTTTDFIAAKLDIDSIQVELVDTAGFETTEDSSGESAGRIVDQAQSHRSAQQDQAQVCLFCIDSSRGLTAWELEQLHEFELENESQNGSVNLVVLTKSDLADSDDQLQHIRVQVQASGYRGSVITTSSLERRGLKQLQRQIAISILDSRQAESSVVGTTVIRAAESLVEAINAVDSALQASQLQVGEEIVAAEIRQALEGLGQVVGTVYTDDILDLVFGRFCIGK